MVAVIDSTEALGVIVETYNCPKGVVLIIKLPILLRSMKLRFNENDARELRNELTKRLRRLRRLQKC
jgi:hypothetical protein